ncbi:MAG: Hsp33 family molecular chaperone HslO [Tissierellia bacterium]|nr:Hsp33 family molecular chaperone HslO [Tissierellia bacterium]
MKDYIIRAIDKNKSIRIFVARTTDMVQKIRDLHKSSATASAAMGRLATMASFMGIDQKVESLKLTLKLDGNGVGGKIIAVADHTGNVRVTASNPRADLPAKSNGKLDVAGFVGTEGSIGIIKDYGLKEPYTGISEIISGEIAEDFANYFFYSEQTPSIISLGVLVDTDLSIKAAGGLFVQVLPNISDDDLTGLEKKVGELLPISELISNNLTPEEILEKYFSEFEPEVLSKIDVKYECNCSRERFEEGLISLGKNELQQIADEDGKADIICEFCRKEYSFNKEDLEKLIKSI